MRPTCALAQEGKQRAISHLLDCRSAVTEFRSQTRPSCAGCSWDALVCWRRNRGIRSHRPPTQSLIVGAALTLITSVVPVPAMAAPTPTASNSLIKNGCLTAPSVSSQWGKFGPGSTSIPDWTIGGNSVDDAVDAAKSGWQPPPGCGYSVDLSGNAPGSVSQAVTTTPGASYELHWYLSGNWNCAPTVKTMHVVWDGHVKDAPTFNTTGLSATSMHWVIQSVIVKATSAESDVRFGDASTRPSSAGAILGDVSLDAAPVVNGFIAANLSGSFGTAERSMLTKIPGNSSVPASAPDCSLSADEANQVQSGAGLQLVWTVSTSSRFLHEAAAARLAGATTVEEYLVSMLKLMSKPPVLPALL